MDESQRRSELLSSFDRELSDLANAKGRTGWTSYAIGLTFTGLGAAVLQIRSASETSLFDVLMAIMYLRTCYQLVLLYLLYGAKPPLDDKRPFVFTSQRWLLEAAVTQFVGSIILAVSLLTIASDRFVEYAPGLGFSVGYILITGMFIHVSLKRLPLRRGHLRMWPIGIHLTITAIAGICFTIASSTWLWTALRDRANDLRLAGVVTASELLLLVLFVQKAPDATYLALQSLRRRLDRSEIDVFQADLEYKSVTDGYTLADLARPFLRDAYQAVVRMKNAAVDTASTLNECIEGFHSQGKSADLRPLMFKALLWSKCFEEALPAEIETFASNIGKTTRLIAELENNISDFDMVGYEQLYDCLHVEFQHACESQNELAYLRFHLLQALDKNFTEVTVESLRELAGTIYEHVPAEFVAEIQNFVETKQNVQEALLHCRKLIDFRQSVPCRRKASVWLKRTFRRYTRRARNTMATLD